MSAGSLEIHVLGLTLAGPVFGNLVGEFLPNFEESGNLNPNVGNLLRGRYRDVEYAQDTPAENNRRSPSPKSEMQEHYKNYIRAGAGPSGSSRCRINWRSLTW